MMLFRNVFLGAIALSGTAFGSSLSDQLTNSSSEIQQIRSNALSKMDITFVCIGDDNPRCMGEDRPYCYGE